MKEGVHKSDFLPGRPQRARFWIERALLKEIFDEWDTIAKFRA